MEDSDKRLFIGIPVPTSGKLVEMVGSMQKTFAASNIKWVNADQWHITLHFLGNVPAGLIPDIRGKMETTLGSAASFSCTLNGLGVFKSVRQPRVIWCGLDPPGPFGPLYDGLTGVLSLTGMDIPQNRYIPHLTLGRIKHVHDRRLLGTWLEKHQHTLFDSFMVNEVNLYESRLTPKGPLYSILFRAKLST